MKLTVKKNLFLKAVNTAERNIGRNLTLPVLNNILIKAEDNKLNVISTDLELAISVVIPARIDKNGSILIQPKPLSGFLVNLDDGEVNVSVEKNQLILQQKNYKSTIKGEDDKEFPLLPKINKKKYFTAISQGIIKALSQVIPSVATNDLKPELGGVLFSTNASQIKLASTDSFRLTEKTLKRENQENITKENFILPLKTAQEIVRNYQDIKDVLFFYLEPNQLAIQNEENDTFNVQIISKLIEGDYPDYAQIIPKQYETKSIVAKKGFMQQVKSASLFASRINDIELKINSQKIELRAENNDVGTFDSKVDAATEGEKQEIRFNYQYLLDGLNSVEGDEIIFKISKSDGPTVLESTKNKDLFYILMPIRK